VQNSTWPLGAVDDPTRPKRRRPLHFLPLADRQTIPRARFGAPSLFVPPTDDSHTSRFLTRIETTVFEAVRPAVPQRHSFASKRGGPSGCGLRHAGAGKSREPYAPLSATPFHTPSFSFRLGLRFGRAVERRTGVRALPFACVVPLSPYTAFHGSDAVRFVRGGRLRCRRMFIVASMSQLFIPQLM
jgi:hypothetical protein